MNNLNKSQLKQYEPILVAILGFIEYGNGTTNDDVFVYRPKFEMKLQDPNVIKFFKETCVDGNKKRVVRDQPCDDFLMQIIDKNNNDLHFKKSFNYKCYIEKANDDKIKNVQYSQYYNIINQFGVVH